jgi:hypothetical protein
MSFFFLSVFFSPKSAITSHTGVVWGSVGFLAGLNAVYSTRLTNGTYHTAGTAEGVLTLRLAVRKVVPDLAGLSSARMVGVTNSAAVAVSAEIVFTACWCTSNFTEWNSDETSALWFVALAWTAIGR